MAKKENATKNFVLRIDAEMMDAIETWAADEFRSTNGQIQYILDQALRKAGRLKKKKQSKNLIILKSLYTIQQKYMKTI